MLKMAMNVQIGSSKVAELGVFRSRSMGRMDLGPEDIGHEQKVPKDIPYNLTKCDRPYMDCDPMVYDAISYFEYFSIFYL